MSHAPWILALYLATLATLMMRRVGREAHSWCKYLEILKARMLGEFLCNQTTLVMLKGAISTILLCEYPFRTDDWSIFGAGHQNPCAIGFVSIQFCWGSCFPLGCIVPAHGVCKWLRMCRTCREALCLGCICFCIFIRVVHIVYKLCWTESPPVSRSLVIPDRKTSANANGAGCSGWWSCRRHRCYNCGRHRRCWLVFILIQELPLRKRHLWSCHWFINMDITIEVRWHILCMWWIKLLVIHNSWMLSRTTVRWAFIEISALRNEGAFGGGIVELPPFVAMWIAYKDTLIIVRVQRSLLVCLYMHIGSGSPDLQVWNIRFATMPQLVVG